MDENEFAAMEELVRSDIEAGLTADKRESAAPFAPWTSEEIGTGILYANAITGGALTAVEWAFHCKHIAPFAGIPATNRVVTIQGVTIVRVRGAKTTYRRYVDWAGLMAELGVSASFRPAFEKMEDIPNIRVEKTKKAAAKRRPVSS